MTCLSMASDSKLHVGRTTTRHIVAREMESLFLFINFQCNIQLELLSNTSHIFNNKSNSPVYVRLQASTALLELDPFQKHQVRESL